MHGSTGSPVNLSSYGGLITLADPGSVPEGASPRTYDTDFLVGLVGSRPGLTNAISIASDGVGPNPGHVAVDVPLDGVPWVNPSNILLDDGSFATFTTTTSGSVTPAPAMTALNWTSPANATSTTLYTTTTGASPVPPGSYSTLIYSSSVAVTSSGAASATTSGPSQATLNVTGWGGSDATFSFAGVPIPPLPAGAVVTGIYPQIDCSGNVGYEVFFSGIVQIQCGIPGGNAVWAGTYTFYGAPGWGTTMATVLSGMATYNSGYLSLAHSGDDPITASTVVINSFALRVEYTVPPTTPLANNLIATVAALSLPSSAVITGVGISFDGYTTGCHSSTIQIQSGGINGSSYAIPWPVSLGAMTFGGSSNLWGFAPSQIASGFDFNIQGPGYGTTYLNTLVITVYYTLSGLSDIIKVTQFSFSLPSTATVTGVTASLKGLSAGATVNAQMVKAGVLTGNIYTATLPTTNTSITLGGLSDNWGVPWTYSDINSSTFGIAYWITGDPSNVVYLDYTTLTVGIVTGAANFVFVQTFTLQDGTVKNVYVDANGLLFIENVTLNPGVLNLLRDDLAPNAEVVGSNGPDVEYLAISDGTQGIDQPLQILPQWQDRITQVGPGAAPVFTPIQSSANSFGITNITQPASASYGSSYFLQSDGPGSSAPGNVVTFYYADSTLIGPNTDLVNAFNSGFPVYVYASFTGTPVTFGPQVVKVASIGEASPPKQPRQFYYFTFNVPSTAYSFYPGSGNPGYTANWQRSLATMTTSVPVPGLSINDQITITGNSVTAYNNTWNIAQDLDSGAFAITQTAVTAGVATITYSLQSGVAPAAGEQVTITGTDNANGALNVAGAVIQTATGGSSGSFTINVSATTNYAATPENGQGVTAGTQFAFDPGVALLGTGTSPIYGTGTGGSLTFAGPSGQLIAPGTKQGTVFFITRNGMWTCPAPPVTFTIPLNTTSIQVTHIPIGPPNVVARGIAFTESGQGGTPGANFFVLPTDVTYIVNDVSYTANSTIINDNTTSSASLFFTDPTLLSAEAIDVYAYNLFNNIEIGDPGWVVNYSLRNFYGLCRNKVQNFLNMSFDGGYLQSTKPAPLGWSQPDTYSSLTVSSKFGNSYYINNTSGGTLATAGLISQPADKDAYKQPILNANTAYSVRVTARIPSGNTTGNLVISLTAAGNTYGTYTLPFSQMTGNFAIYTGTIMPSLDSIPPGLIVNLYATAMGSGADVEIDRVEVFPTGIPVLYTTVFGSYAGLPEQVDSTSGQVVLTSENQQPVAGAVVMYDTLYCLKGALYGTSMYSLQAVPNLEPADWPVTEVAQRAGTIGPLAYDFGEQWFATANRNGLYVFVGGQPGKITQEIFQLWDLINWEQAERIWVRNDVIHRRLYIGVPMSTPNFYLPNAPTVTNPTSPNIILMCNYQGVDSGESLKSEPQMHTTVFGTLNSVDMRRKWSIWQIPSPYAAIVEGATDEQVYICNGRNNSKVYMLDNTNDTDDGLMIDSLYTTAGLVEQTKRQQVQGSGTNRMRWGYMAANLTSSGNVGMTLYPNRLWFGTPPPGYNAWTMPGGFSPGNGLNDVESALNFAATRTYIEFRENDGGRFTMSNLVLKATADVWNQWRGMK